MSIASATPTTPQDPATGAGAKAITPQNPVLAVIVTVVTADKITQRAQLHMGGVHSAARDWHRVGAGSWRSKDADFIEAEDRLGVELAEYMDLLDLPTRVADMLPRHPSDTTSAAFKQAMATVEGLRHG